MAFSSDEKILVTCSYDRTVTRWQFPEGHKLSNFSFKEFPGFKSGGIQFVATRDAGIAVVGDYGGHRYAIDLKAGRELWRTKGAAHELFSMALSPDDRVIASGP